LNIRLGPRADADTSGAILALNSAVTGRRIQFQPNGNGLWVEIEQSRWCAFSHNGLVYLKATDISETDLSSGTATFSIDLPFEVILNVNIRKEPSTINSPDGSLGVGAAILGKRIKFQPNGAWIGFKKDGQDRWCAFVHNGVNYLKAK
jgi:hypothetical protein